MPNQRRREQRHQIGDFYLQQRADTGKWHVCRYVHTTDEQGKSKRIVRREPGAYGTLEEAQDALARAAIARPSRTQAATIAYVLDYWYEHRGQNLVSYEAALSALQWFTRFLGVAGISVNTPAASLKPQVFRDFAAWRANHGGVNADEPVGGNTISRNLAVVRAAFTFAWREELVDRKIHVPDVDPAQKAGPKTDRLSVVELGRLYHGADGHLQDYVFAMITTVGRPTAVKELTDENCDWENDLIDLNPAGRRQNNKKRPVVPMCSAFKERFQGRIGPLIGIPVEPDDEDEGEHVTRRAINSTRTSFGRLRLLLGLPDTIQPKTIRYSVASLLRSNPEFRIAPWELEGLLGHDGKHMSEVYAPWQPHEAKHVADTLDRIFTAVRSSCDPEAVRAEMEAERIRLKDMVESDITSALAHQPDGASGMSRIPRGTFKIRLFLNRKKRLEAKAAVKAQSDRNPKIVPLRPSLSQSR